MPVADYTHLLPTFEPVPSSRTNMGKRLAALGSEKKEGHQAEYSPFSHRSSWTHESAVYREMPSADRYDRVAAQGDGPAASGNSGSGPRGTGFAGTGRTQGGAPTSGGGAPASGGDSKPVPDHISKKSYRKNLGAHAAGGAAAGAGLTYLVNHFRNSDRDRGNRARPGPPRRYDDRGYRQYDDRRYREETPAGYVPTDVAGKHYLRTFGGAALGSGVLTAAALRYRNRNREGIEEAVSKAQAAKRAGDVLAKARQVGPKVLKAGGKALAQGAVQKVGNVAIGQAIKRGSAATGKGLASGTLSSIPFLGMGYGVSKLEQPQQQER